ncbi:MAG: hypothetical protein SVX43_19440, partial [Cyanobacteriota bacterium]|nr:hypothetical protein [Cyanobacteriota bacterium]
MTTKQLALAIDLPPAPPEPQRTNARRRKSLKKSPQEKAREREAEYAAAMATAIARLPQFRFGTIVEQRNRCGLVVGKARSPEIPQLWIRWESCCEFRVYEKFPECVLLDDSLTVRSQRPKPNLPADV